MNTTRMINKILPPAIINQLKKIKARMLWRKYKPLSTKEIFATIYKEQIWGSDSAFSGEYFSGGGSHDETLIKPYIEEVRKFTLSFDSKPNVMDIGCGDFNIGSKIRDTCDKYIACDIVDFLIDQNKKIYKELNVDFKVFDLINERCEKVDIVFLRQVLQHLSNADIQKGLKNILPYCKYLVLTEHVPLQDDFKKNLDKPTGPDVRTKLNSGVDITAPPFNYSLQGKCICEVFDSVGIIRTIVFKCN